MWNAISLYIALAITSHVEDKDGVAEHNPCGHPKCDPAIRWNEELLDWVQRGALGTVDDEHLNTAASQINRCIDARHITYTLCQDALILFILFCQCHFARLHNYYRRLDFRLNAG